MIKNHFWPIFRGGGRGSPMTGSSSCSYLLDLSIIWTFLQSRNSFFARYLSTMSWEECASFWVAVVLLMPREPFALIYFFATFLTFLPSVRLSMFETSGSVSKPSVHVDYAFFLTLVFFFPTYIIMDVSKQQEIAQCPRKNTACWKGVKNGWKRTFWFCWSFNTKYINPEILDHCRQSFSFPVTGTRGNNFHRFFKWLQGFSQYMKWKSDISIMGLDIFTTNSRVGLHQTWDFWAILNNFPRNLSL